jgi:hypothetical protein
MNVQHPEANYRDVRFVRLIILKDYQRQIFDRQFSYRFLCETQITFVARYISVYYRKVKVLKLQFGFNHIRRVSAERRRLRAECDSLPSTLHRDSGDA